MNARAEPWKRDDWESGWLESTQGGRTAVLVLWIFTLGWNAASWFAMLGVLRGNATGNTELAPLFPAIGVGLVALAGYVTLQHRKWGGTRVEMLTLPGVLGGPLRCVLHASTHLARASDLHVSVDCIGAEPGEGVIRAIKHLWHHEERLPRAVFEIDDEARVPLEFDLPYDLPESDAHPGADDPVWSLTVHAEVPGVDFHGKFALPVFRTPESSPQEPGSRAEPTSLRDALADSTIRVHPYGASGREFIFGMLRNPWMGLFMIGATALFCLFVTMILYADGPALFALVFTATTLFLAYATIDTLFGVTRVRAERGRIHVRHGPFGIGPGRRVQLHELVAIRAVPQMQHGNRMYYQIKIEHRPGGHRTRKITAGTRIPTQTEAEALVRAMEVATGV